MRKTVVQPVVGPMITAVGLWATLGLFSPAFGADGVWEALTGGKPKLDVRYRFEWVDQEGKDKHSDANTVRTRLGYGTEPYEGVGGYLELEDIRTLGADRFNDTKNGETQYPVVADPPDTEVNQAYLNFEGPLDTLVRFGRQRIILDNARFVGNVGWRQNEQTFDAVLIANRSLPHTTLTYVFVRNANRIFGEHHPVNGDARMKSHLVNLAVHTPAGVLVGYGYLLDYDKTPGGNTKTFGLRFTGNHAATEALKILYAAETASQSNFADGLSTNDAEYLMAELGGAFHGLSATAGIERLGGDGTYGFSTPLATLHAFQGWADQFLATPADGVRDLYLKALATLVGIKWTAVYHDFASDRNHYRFGEEVDLSAVKNFDKKIVLGLKFASYHADDNGRNAGTPALNAKKFWVWIQTMF
jgi:hypothetical protein